MGGEAKKGEHPSELSIFFLWSSCQMKVAHEIFHTYKSIMEEVEKWPKKPIKKILKFKKSKRLEKRNRMGHANQSYKDGI